MAVTNAVLDVMLAKGFLDHVVRMGELLRKRLDKLIRSYPAVLAEVRGKGLMIGVRCVVSNETLLKRLIEKKMLAMRGGDNVIRLLPPLIIQEQHIDEAINILEDVCKDVSSVVKD